MNFYAVPEMGRFYIKVLPTTLSGEESGSRHIKVYAQNREGVERSSAASERGGAAGS